MGFAWYTFFVIDLFQILNSSIPRIKFEQIVSTSDPRKLADQIQKFLLSNQGYQMMADNPKAAENFFNILSTFLASEQNKWQKENHKVEITRNFSDEFHKKLEQLLVEYESKTSN